MPYPSHNTQLDLKEAISQCRIKLFSENVTPASFLIKPVEKDIFMGTDCTAELFPLFFMP